MKPEFLLGSTGGGGGGGYRNVPDNLRSTDTFEVLMGISSSRAKLAPGGLKNLYVNNVPVEDGSGNASFTDFTANLFDGDPAVLETVKLRLGQSAGQTSVGLTLSNPYTNGNPGDWKNAAVTLPGVEFIDLRFVVQQLYNQTKKGISDETARVEIQLQPSGSATWINPLLDVAAPVFNENGINMGTTKSYLPRAWWVAPGELVSPQWADANPGYLTLKGKTTSPYVKELRVAVPNSGTYANKTWSVRCRLIENDYAVSGTNGENEYRRTISWESIAGAFTTAVGGTEAWRGLSYLTLYGKATDQITGIPEMTGIYDLGEHLVPPNTVWNPSTQLYTGAAWDGTTTQVAWTRCPAWQIKGLIEDDLSGISALAPGSTLNKWDALEASKWFSTLVPDGKGGSHPRYSANWFIDQPMQAHELVNYLAGSVGALCWDEGNGEWRMKVEKPDAPAMVFTKENIIGEFLYSHTDIDSRFNQIIGVFRNEENLFAEDRVRVFDATDISARGLKPTSIALVGCTNRQEALRRLKVRLLTSLKETRLVTFTTNRLGLLLEPLSVIAVADADLNADTALRSTGRILSLNGARTEVTLRDTVRLEVGVSYTLHVTVPNTAYTPSTTTQPSDAEWRKPTINITRAITNTAGQRGDVTTLYLDQALPTNIPDKATFALEAVGLPALPKSYRVTNIQVADGDIDKVTISGIEIYVNKWSESDSVTESAMASQLNTRTVPPPTAPAGGMFVLREFQSEIGKQRVLVTSWARPITQFLDAYRIEHCYNNGPWVDLGVTTETFYELPNPEQGLHQFRIYTRDRRGSFSLPLIGSVELDESLLIVPTPMLTNSAAVVNADAAGTVASFTPAGGVFELRYPSGPITTGVTYSVVSASGGLSIAIDAAGIYTVSALTSDTGTATLRAVFDGQTFDQVYMLSKARAGAGGATGATGLNSAAVALYQRTVTNSAPSVVTTGTATYTFATGGITSQPTDWTTAIPSVASGGYLWVIRAAVSANTATVGIANTGWGSPVLMVQDGASGAAGTPAVTTVLQPETRQVPSFSNGTVTDYTGVATTMALYVGSTDVSASFALSIQSNPQALTTSIASRTVTITGAGATDGQFGSTAVDAANLTIRATGSGAYSGVVIDKVFTLTKVRGGYEIVGALPGTNLFEGRVVYLTTDDKLYRYTGSAWTKDVPTTDLTGQIASAQIADGAVAVAKFAAGIEPVTIVTSVPGTKSTNSIFNTTDGKLYRWNGSAYTAAVPTTDLSGQIANGQIAAGAVRANQMGVGLGGNMLMGALPNSNPHRYLAINYNPDGKTYATNGYGGNALVSSESPFAGGQTFGPEWSLPDHSTHAIYQPNNSAGGSGFSQFLYQRQVTTAGGVSIFYAVEPNKYYEFSVYTGAHRCRGDAMIFWFDSAYTYIGETVGTNNNQEMSGGTTLDTYKRLVSRGQAPATAKFCGVGIRKYHTATGVDSWVFLTRPMLTETVANATEITPWTPPPDSLIHAEMLQAGSVVATKIAAGAIETDKIAANAITTGKLAADSVTAAQIAAGAVTASEIAATAITASKLELFPNNMIVDPYFRDTDYWNTIPAGGSWDNFTGSGWYRERANQSSGAQTNANNVGASEYIALWEGRPGFSPTTRYHCYSFGTGVAGKLDCKPGKVYELKAGCQNYTNQDIVVAIEFLDDTGGFIGGVTGGSLVWNPGQISTKETQFTAPANTAFGRIVIYNQSGSTMTGSAVVGAPVVREAASASMIVDGSIKAAKIAAGAITASKLAIGDINNYLLNGDMRSGTLDGWCRQVVSNGGDSISVVSGADWPGNNALYFTRANGNSGELSITNGNTSFDDVNMKEGIDLAPNDELWFEGVVFTTSASTPVLVDCVSRQNSSTIAVLPAYALSNCTVSGSTALTASGSFTRFTGYFKNTTGATSKAYIRISVGSNSSGSTQYVYMWNMKALRRNKGELIVDGAIIANKLAADSVTANAIQAGAVTAAKIDVTQLSAINANVGLLRTATSGARVEIEANQVRVYDSSNTLRVRLGVW